MNFLKYIIKESIKEIQELDNAMNKIKEIKMSNWNGKIKCTYNNSDFTVGKIYEIKNGELIDDVKYSFGYYDNINQINVDLCSQFEEVKETKIPVLCEILSVEPLKKFGIQFNFNNNQISKERYYIDTYGHLLAEGGVSKDACVPYLISGEYQIVKSPQYQFTEDELTILSGLFLNNYSYIARDKDGRLWGYDTEPIEEDDESIYDNSDGELACKLNDEFFQQIQWGNVLDIENEITKLN